MVKKHISESLECRTFNRFGKDISQIQLRVDMLSLDEVVMSESLYPVLTLINVSQVECSAISENFCRRIIHD
jgi:hypothetical protein